MPSTRPLIYLSLICFALADVRDGLGPFLGVYLQSLHWQADRIGYVMTLGGLVGTLFATPAGVWVDATRHKRLLLALACITIIGSLMLIFVFHHTWLIALSQILQGAAAALIAPLITSITLGIVGQKNLAHRLGTNEAFNHAGNAVAAVAGGIFGYYFGIIAVFLIMLAFAIMTIIAAVLLDKRAINYNVARGLNAQNPTSTSLSFRSLYTNKSLVLFGVVVAFFHLANAAMLPLLGQSVVDAFDVNPAVYTALTILIAQGVMIMSALVSARTAQREGYTKVMGVAILALLVRGMVGGIYQNPWVLVPIQILDGISAGIIGVATPGIVAVMLRGTGHINAGFGFVMALQGVGAALSTSYGGVVANAWGYRAAFLALGFIALCTFILWRICARTFKD